LRANPEIVACAVASTPRGNHGIVERTRFERVYHLIADESRQSLPRLSLLHAGALRNAGDRFPVASLDQSLERTQIRGRVGAVDSAMIE
jgi:hypothetical protein